MHTYLTTQCNDKTEKLEDLCMYNINIQRSDIILFLHFFAYKFSDIWFVPEQKNLPFVEILYNPVQIDLHILPPDIYRLIKIDREQRMVIFPVWEIDSVMLNN